MSEISERFARLSDDFANTVAAVPAERWGDASPCEGWNARDVVRHVVDARAMQLGFVGREPGAIPPVDEDPLGAVRATGLDERMDAADVRWVADQAEALVDALRLDRVCGPALTPPPGADEQTRLLAHLGRRAW